MTENAMKPLAELSAAIDSSDLSRASAVIADDLCEDYLTDNLFDFIPCVTRHLRKLGEVPENQFTDLLIKLMKKAASVSDPDEYILLLSGQLTTSIDHSTFSLYLDLFKFCISRMSKKRFPRIHSIFTQVSAKLFSCVASEKPKKSLLSKILSPTLEFYTFIATIDEFFTDEKHVQWFSSHVLFIMSHVLMHFESYPSADSISSLINIFLKLNPDLYTFYQCTIDNVGDRKLEHVQPAIALPALSFLLFHVNFNTGLKLNSCSWPRELSTKSLYDSCISTASLVIDPSNKSMLTEIPAKPQFKLVIKADSTYACYMCFQTFAVKLLNTAFVTFQPSLTHVELVSQLETVENLIVQPLTGDDLPEVISKSIDHFRHCLTSQPAETQLVVLERFLDHEHLSQAHYGWYAQLVTYAKDWAAQIWTINQEPTIDLDFTHCFNKLFECIYRFPMTELGSAVPYSAEQLINESCWVSAGLNLLLYAFLRSSLLQLRCHAVTQAFLASLVKTVPLLTDNFVKPLNASIDRALYELHVKRCQAEKDIEHSSSKSATQRFESQLAGLDKQSLRIRLVKSTLSRVSEAYCQMRQVFVDAGLPKTSWV